MIRTKSDMEMQAAHEPGLMDAYALGRQHEKDESVGLLRKEYMRGWFEAQQKLLPEIKRAAYEAGRLQGLQDAFNAALEAANDLANPEHAAVGRVVAHRIRRAAGP